MPTITVIIEGQETKSFEASENQRLVLAIEGAGIDIGHRCGGNAQCTTCRVSFDDGEPNEMTQAEKDILAKNNLTGQVRLSCQILCKTDMTVSPKLLVSKEGWDSPGHTPKDTITPEPEWTVK